MTKQSKIQEDYNQENDVILLKWNLFTLEVSLNLNGIYIYVVNFNIG